MVYLDDVLIFSTSFQEHIDSIKESVSTLCKSNLKVQIDKCYFSALCTKLLGHVVSAEGVKTDPSKIEVIQSIKLPAREKKIWQFLGITG